MKDNLASINIILDGSGSMGPLVNDTIGGFNKFLEEQKEFPGEALLTLCVFNAEYKLIHDCVPLSSVPSLNKDNYKPNGGTALLDAVGLTIDNVGKKLSTMKEEDRPSKVLFLIITDGEENASHLVDENPSRIVSESNSRHTQLRYPITKIKEMVLHQQSIYKWEFLFFGANVDSFSESKSLGIPSANSMNYSSTHTGVRDLYKSISNSTTKARM